MAAKQLSLAQLVKGYDVFRPSCTPSLITTIADQLQHPIHDSRYSNENREMRRYLQWRLHLSSTQLDSVLLGAFVTMFADELNQMADENGS